MDKYAEESLTAIETAEQYLTRYEEMINEKQSILEFSKYIDLEEGSFDQTAFDNSLEEINKQREELEQRKREIIDMYKVRESKLKMTEVLCRTTSTTYRKHVEDIQITSTAYIFVPVHICYTDIKEHYRMLRRCLKSLTNQSHKAKVFVSISFESNKHMESFDKLIREFPDVMFVSNADRMSQMEHLYQLTQMFLLKDPPGIVMFCCDDDEYDYERVQMLLKTYDGLKCIPKSKNLYAIIETAKDQVDCSTSLRPELWRYALPPLTLIRFFTFFDNIYQKILLESHVAVEYLKSYLRYQLFDTRQFLATCEINQMTYIKNYYNKNSHTNKLRTISHNCPDKISPLLLTEMLKAVINCEDEFDDMCKEHNIKFDDKEKHFPQRSDVFKFCRKLYFSGYDKAAFKRLNNAMDKTTCYALQ